jgi:hypothetical protein
MILILLAYKVSQFDYEYANFDPYEILGVPLVSTELTVFIVFFTEKREVCSVYIHVHVVFPIP